jgi:hypothetical protein
MASFIHTLCSLKIPATCIFSATCILLYVKHHLDERVTGLANLGINNNFALKVAPNFVNGITVLLLWVCRDGPNQTKSKMKHSVSILNSNGDPSMHCFGLPLLQFAE